MRKLPAPAGLGPAGKRFWGDVTGEFQLRVDERRILVDACREIDLIERLDEQLASSDLLVEGSQGQDVASPLVQELRQHRAVLRLLLQALKLPDGPAARQQEERSSSARRAAMARWA